jgi:hypothetical protein
LQPLARTPNVSESRFSVEAQGEYATSYANGWLSRFERRCVDISVLLKKFRRGCRPIEFVGIRFMPASLDFGELFLAL